MSSASISQSANRLPGLRRLPRQPRVLCLGHALKETLAVAVARRSLELGVTLAGGSVSAAYCLSDGGDGFLQAYASAVQGGRRLRFVCPGPQGVLVIAEVLYIESQRTAVIESAQAVGLGLVPAHRRDVRTSGTAGLGVLLAGAVRLGARRLHVGLGGSATCDGGIGMLARLAGELSLGDVPRDAFLTAQDLAEAHTIPVASLRDWFRGIELKVFCDVANPLLGSLGTAHTFAPQKGASPNQVEWLEEHLADWANRLEAATGSSLRDEAGTGAAGGLGFALALIGGKLTLGAESICELLRLDTLLGSADGVVTCEGRFDRTSFHGKAPWYAAQQAARRGLPALIACGSADEEAVRRAASEGVTVREFGGGVDPEHRTAEAFPRMQRCVQDWIETGG